MPELSSESISLTEEKFIVPGMKMSVVFFVLSASLPGLLRGAEIQERPELAAAFQRAGARGTFVLWDPGTRTFQGHQAERAKTRFVPASTFKIPNTLIGLDCGAVSGVDEVFPYDGKPRFLKEWERDMSLRDGIKVSNVPVYQELARRIGLKRMQAAVEKLGYGNRHIGTVVDRFWLDGPLEISALEQVEFLRRLAAGDLPVSRQAQDAVREILLLETKGGSRLYGKTGWLMARQPDLGWFVGWVEKDGVSYPFALNMDLPSKDLGPTRVALARECLALLGKF